MKKAIFILISLFSAFQIAYSAKGLPVCAVATNCANGNTVSCSGEWECRRTPDWVKCDGVYENC